MMNFPEELPLLSASIAIALSKETTADELNIIGNLFAGIGAEMMTIAAIRSSKEQKLLTPLN